MDSPTALLPQQRTEWTPPPLAGPAWSRNPLTGGNGDVGPDAEPGEDERPRLALPPARPVHQHVHEHLGWDLNDTKHKLGQVDAEPKARQVHAHAVVREGNSKPARRGQRWGPGDPCGTRRGNPPVEGHPLPHHARTQRDPPQHWGPEQADVGVTPCHALVCCHPCESLPEMERRE